MLQQIHSLRASGVRLCQTPSAVGAEVSSFRRSAGILCAVPPAISFVIMNSVYLRLYSLEIAVAFAESHGSVLVVRYNDLMEWNIVKSGVRNALLASVYVTAVGLFMSRASMIFGEKDTAVTPVAVLMLLVFSAALMGILVFGQPLIWYLDGKKKAALNLLGYTMAALLALMILAFVALLVIR